MKPHIGICWLLCQPVRWLGDDWEIYLPILLARDLTPRLGYYHAVIHVGTWGPGVCGSQMLLWGLTVLRTQQHPGDWSRTAVMWVGQREMSLTTTTAGVVIVIPLAALGIRVLILPHRLPHSQCDRMFTAHLRQLKSRKAKDLSKEGQ